MTNFKQLSASFPADSSPVSRPSGEWVNLYTRAHSRRQKCMKDAEVMRINVLKQRENDLEKYRREQLTGGPGKSKINSLTVSKTPAAFKPSSNNSRSTAPSKVSLYSVSSSNSLSPPANLKWPSSVPPRLRKPCKTSPRQKKQPTTLPPLRGTLETNYINIANMYGNTSRQTPQDTTIDYRLPHKEWSPADSTPKTLEGNPSGLCDISKVWEHGMCIYCELERIERSIPRTPRFFKWRSKDRMKSFSMNVDSRGEGDGACVIGGNNRPTDRTNDEYDGDNDNGIMRNLEYEPDIYVDTTSIRDDLSIRENYSGTNKRKEESDEEEVEIDYEALEKLAKWYERYPSTPVSFWKQRDQRTFQPLF
ncbi:uncharacterized protein LOC121429910 [Lytechinus variegatus]|uniref:uncharacterized protein LOC121429910 n=1 Tax=Lytechinus variegatus TaxID=7654 RepID=UPI001BB25CFF|nr:uncharacterized protein LOC121429910 [Lytechinus variegatus]